MNHIATLVRLFGLTQMPKSNEGTPIVGMASPTPGDFGVFVDMDVNDFSLFAHRHRHLGTHGNISKHAAFGSQFKTFLTATPESVI